MRIYTWRNPSWPVGGTDRGLEGKLDEDFDIKKHRERLRKMTDEQLLISGQIAKYLCSPEATLGRPPRKVFVIQLAEVKSGWERRKKLKEHEKEKGSRSGNDSK